MAGCDIEAELAALPSLSAAALRERWEQVTGRPVPQVRPTLLRLALAWELQAAEYGGVSRHTEQRIRALASGSASAPPVPGSRLVREWNGTLHTVVIGDEGAITWNGTSWNSLSEVARAITGTRWSGPAFFGLKAKRKAA